MREIGTSESKSTCDPLSLPTQVALPLLPLSYQVERKRARNRVAASKCRLRKLERISVLDAQAQTLKADNERLAALADKLRCSY